MVFVCYLWYPSLSFSLPKIPSKKDCTTIIVGTSAAESNLRRRYRVRVGKRAQFKSVFVSVLDKQRFLPPKQTVLYASEQKFNLCLKFGLPSDLSGPLSNVDKSAIFAHFWTKKGPYFHFGPCLIGSKMKYVFILDPVL